MPFDPEAEPWLNAKVLIAEHGEDVVEEFWRLGWEYAGSGRSRDIPKLVAAMRAMKDLGWTRHRQMVH